MTTNINFENLQNDAAEIFNSGFACSESVIYAIRKHFEIDLSAFEFAVEPKRFDFKQFLCHLFGIAYPSGGRDGKSKAKLVYLFFKPMCEDTDMDTIFDELCCEIRSVFDNKHIKLFCKANDIELYAIAQHSSIMESLDKTGYIKLFPC